MKRCSSNYRLQLIKQVANRQQHSADYDPMANYIYELLAKTPDATPTRDTKQNFSGNHYDEKVGGWVSDAWNESPISPNKHHS